MDWNIQHQPHEIQIQVICLEIVAHWGLHQAKSNKNWENKKYLDPSRVFAASIVSPHSHTRSHLTSGGYLSFFLCVGFFPVFMVLAELRYSYLHYMLMTCMMIVSITWAHGNSTPEGPKWDSNPDPQNWKADTMTIKPWMDQEYIVIARHGARASFSKCQSLHRITCQSSSFMAWRPGYSRKSKHRINFQILEQEWRLLSGQPHYISFSILSFLQWTI